MTPQEFEMLINTPTADGRVHEKVEDPHELLEAKNQIVRARKADGTCLYGGIINHVDPALQYLYVRSVVTKQCFCLQISCCVFWLLPPKDEGGRWGEVCSVIRQQNNL